MIADDPEIDVAEAWEKEVKALERLKLEKIAHSVRFVNKLCLFDNDSTDYYMIFEWADGGSLQTLWQEQQKPQLNASLVKWACRQLHGLALALHTAHDLEGDFNIRHGDLKPNNILWFKAKAQDDGFGTLKIADWGLAKEHSDKTVLRAYDTTARWGTKRYEAPEVKRARLRKFDKAKSAHLEVPGQPKPMDVRSRLSDIWAMGCIALEYLIWLLYGLDELQRFKHEIGEDTQPFFVIEDDETQRLLPVVERWMNHMSGEALCSKDTALGNLLECIKSGLLVCTLPPNKGDRSNSYPLPTNVPERPPSNNDANPDAPSFQFQLTRTDTAKSSALAGSNCRLLASEFMEEMHKITAADANSSEDFWFVESTPSPPPMEGTSSSSPGEQGGPENNVSKASRLEKPEALIV